MDKYTHFALALLGTALAIVFEGFVMQHLWQWFVATKFSLPLLSIQEAYGLIVLIHFVTFKMQDQHQYQTEFEKWFSIFFAPAMFLALGFTISRHI